MIAVRVDLNCDLGEGAGRDADLIALVTTANIACGRHAGTPTDMAAALASAAARGVAVGAHPGHADPAHFGRRELAMSPNDVFRECVYQVGALAGLARAAGVRLGHLKPHGALYHQACREDNYARPVVEAAALFGLAVVGLPGSRLAAACTGRVRFVAEGFADRRYGADGSLVPRDQPGAFVADPEEAVAQAERLLTAGVVETICVHGDNAEAVAFVRALRAGLTARGHELAAWPV